MIQSRIHDNDGRTCSAMRLVLRRKLERACLRWLSSLVRRYAVNHVAQPPTFLKRELSRDHVCRPVLSLASIYQAKYSFSNMSVQLTLRESLNGSWILDKTKPYSMKDYLAVMHLDELAILAHEKGEQEQDTIQTIELDQQQLVLYKFSRVNNNLRVQLRLGEEFLEHLKPGERIKKQIATSTSPRELLITSSLDTLNGLATVLDQRQLAEDGAHMQQTLSIRNEQTGETSTTTRFFLPYDETPPHLLLATEEATPSTTTEDIGIDDLNDM
jgi:hypothetical protein